MERFRDVLTGLRGQIPESLLAGPGWEHLLGRVGDLPAAAASSLCGFEFRLDEPAPAADFSGPASRGRVARHYIARGEAAATPSTEAWLAGRLRDPSATGRWLESVLLAYDIIGTTPERPAPPVVYLGMRFSPRRRGGVAAAPAEIAAAVAQASARDDAEPERRALTRALRCLPPDAKLAWVGATPGRAPRSVRLLAADIAPREIGPLLERLEWPGSIATVLRLLSDMSDLCGRFLLLVDVTEHGALPRIGLEMHVVRDVANFRALFAAWLLSSKQDWRPVIERLADWRLCLPAKAEGLLDWPRLRTVFSADGALQLYMGINHVKLTVEADEVRAKAYGGLRLLPPGQLAKRAFFGE